MPTHDRIRAYVALNATLFNDCPGPALVPVATVAVGGAGARNAAYLAGQILALNDAQLAAALAADREENQAKVRAQNERLQAELKG